MPERPLLQDPLAWSAFAVAMAATGLCAAPAGSWLDSGEFIAAARTLGVVHPPGHPAWLSLSGLSELLPLGPHAARVAWLSALFAGVAALLQVRLARLLLADYVQGWQAEVWAGLAALGLLASGSLWQVATRAEVYTLALAGNLWMLLAALRAGRAAERGEPLAGDLGAAAVAFCVGALNHHYIALFALPPALLAAWPALRRVAGRDRRLALALLAGCVWLALAYAALWLRARTDVELRWGDPTSLGGLWDTVTAKHFQRSVAAAQVHYGDNLMVLLAMVVDSGGIALPVAGLLGLGLGGLLRTRAAAVLATTLLLGLLTKGLMQIDTHNADDHGYVLMAVAALALGVAQLGAVLARAPKAATWLAGGLGLAAAALQVPALLGDVASNPAALRAPETLDSQARREVAPGSLVLTNYYGAQYSEAAFRLGEGRRPDWQVVHLSFRVGDTDGGRGHAAWLQSRYPQLAPLAQEALRAQAAPVPGLLALLQQQPVYAELDPQARLEPEVWRFGTLFQRLAPKDESAAPYDLVQLRQAQHRAWQDLYSRLTPADLADHPTRMVLLLQHALQAAQALRRGWRDTARDEVARARLLAPQDQLVARLQRYVAALDATWQQGGPPAYAAKVREWRGRDFDALLAADP